MAGESPGAAVGRARGYSGHGHVWARSAAFRPSVVGPDPSSAASTSRFSARAAAARSSGASWPRRRHAADGDIGRVQGLVIDPRNHHVTHVLFRKGHLPGRQEIAIPISAVASTGNGIRLKITKQEVRDLPPVDIDHPDAGTGGRGGHG